MRQFTVLLLVFCTGCNALTPRRSLIYPDPPTTISESGEIVDTSTPGRPRPRFDTPLTTGEKIEESAKLVVAGGVVAVLAIVYIAIYASK